ncbi:MAG: hypothetical protein K2G41_04515, partial [Duncaniella sp.]|uniref:hypothetical protein n=1 Tax=Duncaniella sp. TaxID=2518496 RepID=UPI0023BCE45B
NIAPNTLKIYVLGAIVKIFPGQLCGVPRMPNEKRIKYIRIMTHQSFLCGCIVFLSGEFFNPGCICRVRWDLPFTRASR